MVKKIGYTILIVIGLLFTVGYFRYNPTVNITNVIPISADAIVRVNLREIEYNMVKDVVKHPFSYFKSTKNSGSTESRLSLFDQIVIPTNVFFYTNYSNLKNRWISSVIEIKDKTNLQAFFKQEKLVRKTIDDIEYFTHKNVVYFIANNELRILFSFNKITKVENILSVVLKGENYLGEKEGILSNIKTSNQLIAVSTKKEGFFELSMSSEELSIKGQLNQKNNLFLPYKIQKNTNSLASISGRINKQLLFGLVKTKQKERFEKLVNLSLDSINNHWDGEVDINLESFIKRNDTIITYEYDDDFNKVEKKSIQKKVVPKLNIRIGGSTFFDYLLSKDAIKNIEKENLLVVNPFFKTYANKRKNELFLFSNGTYKDDSVRSEKNKFLLFFNVEKYLQNESDFYSISKEYFSSVRNIKAVVTKENKIEIVVNLKGTPQKFMYQILKEFNTMQKQ